MRLASRINVLLVSHTLIFLLFFYSTLKASLARYSSPY